MRGKNAKSLANLKPAKPGEVRNPQGKNRKRPYTDRHFEMGESPVPEKIRARINRRAGAEIVKPGAAWADAEVANTHLGAAMGGIKEIKEISDRIEGKPPQRLEISGPTEQRITLLVRFEERKKGQ